MEIKGLITGLQSYEQSRINKDKGRGSPGTGAPRSSSDRVSLSQDAKLFRTGLEQAMKADDVRADRVEELKARVKDGTYEPDSRRIAEKMIREDMDTWFQRS
ncbi:flagellar biosynthesis anti-sigma factor FlgM [Desulfonatronovibrio magnus]|uniref:flagellar biosynthesis anti-sigma factor FlgM n=1 Tax=Desulfonatronovibrio magnus TaxID=698827 RepID=UPI0005EB8A89|nr:flagellar biosynthesis anti-sigma factor FlgM [Desulfonatronovibrio magnus]